MHQVPLDTLERDVQQPTPIFRHIITFVAIENPVNIIFNPKYFRV